MASVSRPSSKTYSAMFSMFAFGLLFVIAGLIGYEAHGNLSLNAPSRWKGEVITRQVVLGVALLGIGFILWRRISHATGQSKGAGSPPHRLTD